MPKGVYKRTGKHKKKLAEHMKRIRIMRKPLTVEQKFANSLRQRGRKFSKEHRRKLRKAKLINPVRYWLGRKDKPKHSKRIRRKMSLAKLGKLNPRYGCLPPKVNWIKYNGKLFRSSWEARFAKALDKRGIEWKYESRTFNLGNTTYTPDFYLPKQGAYWEIKGWLSPSSKEKLKRFRKKYPNIKLVLANRPVLKRIKNFFKMEI